MLVTSELYKQHFEAGSIQEYKVIISGVEYTDSVLYDVPTVTQNLFDKPTLTVGSLTISELNLKLKVPSGDIESSAPITFHYRYVSNDLPPSEWVQKFSGKISKRTKFSEEVTTIQAKSKASNYTTFLSTDTSAITSYPASNRLVTQMCADILGVTVDNIEDVYDANNVEFPNEMTAVEVLQNIAKLSGGNWIITEDDKLRLVVLRSEVLIDVPEYRSQSYEQHSTISPISQVQVYWDDVSAFEAGDDTMSTIIINTPWATRNSTDYIYSVLGGYQYKPTQGNQVYADPAIQLGDTFTYGDTNQLVASVIWHFDGSVTGDFNAPQNNDSNLDDPRSILIQNEFKKKISLGDSYQGVSIGRQDGIQMLLSPDGSEENAIGRYYSDLNKGMAFQTRGNPMLPWQDWLYFDMESKLFRLSLYSTTDEVEDMIDEIELNRTWNAYSANSDGEHYTLNPQPDTRYWGTATGTFRPTNESGYEWSLIRGADGTDGVDGTDGENGKSVFRAYADTELGGGFSITNSQKDWLGLYIGLPPQSTTPSDYDWQPSGFKNSREITAVSLELDAVAGSVDILTTQVNDEADKTAQLRIDVDSIESTVENIPNGNLMTNGSGELGFLGWSGGSRARYVTPKIRYMDGLTYSMGFIPQQNLQSLAEWEISIYEQGYSVTPIIFIVPDIEHSYRAKITSSGAQTIDVLEFNSIENANDLTPDKTTSFTSAGSGTRYFEFTFTPSTSTQFVRIRYNHYVGVSVQQRISITEVMFNRGQPREWQPSPNNASAYSNSVRTQLSNQITDVVTEVDRVSGDIHNTTVSISASKGVEITATNGVGLRIKDEYGTDTLTLTTDGFIKAVGAILQEATITGNLAAGTIAGLVFNDSKITFPDGLLALDSKENAIKFGGFELIHGLFEDQGGEFTIDGMKFSQGGQQSNDGIYIRDGESVLKTTLLEANGIGNFMGAGPQINNATYPLGLNNAPVSFYVDPNNWVKATPAVGGFTANNDMGSSVHRLSNVYIENQPNVSSDVRYKSNVQDINPKLIEIIGREIKPKQYRTQFDDKIHFGYIAQDVERALYKYCGHDKDKYAMLSKDESYMSLLYGELNVIIEAYNRKRNDELEERIERLEELLNDTKKP